VPRAQCGVDGREGGPDHLAVFADEDALEERLVEQPSLQGRASHVGRVRRLGLGERLIEPAIDVSGVQFGGVEELLGLLLLIVQPLLLAR